MVTITDEDYSSHYAHMDFPRGIPEGIHNLIDAMKAAVPHLLDAAASKRQDAHEAKEKKELEETAKASAPAAPPATESAEETPF